MTYPLLLSARRIKTVVLTFLLFFYLRVGAQVPPPAPGTYVNDLAKVLVPGEVAALNGRIRDLENKYGVQLAVVLVQKLPDTVEIEDFALNIGRERHVGTDRKGLVYVASISQHKQRLEVAANLEGNIPDVTAHAITDDMKPLFRNKDYAGALRTLIDEVEEHLPRDTTGVAAAVAAAPAQDAIGVQPPSNGGSPGVFQWLVIGLVVFSIPVIVGLVRLFGGRSEGDDAGSGYSSGGSDWATDTGGSGSSYSSGDSGSSSDSSSSSDSGFDGGGSSNDW